VRRIQVAYYRRDDPSRNIHSYKLVEAPHTNVKRTLRDVVHFDLENAIITGIGKISVPAPEPGTIASSRPETGMLLGVRRDRKATFWSSVPGSNTKIS
jgi:hypothetical protein